MTLADSLEFSRWLQPVAGDTTPSPSSSTTMTFTGQPSPVTYTAGSMDNARSKEWKCTSRTELRR